MSRTPTPNDGMTRKELDIGDSDLSLDPIGLLDEPEREEEEVDVLPGDPAEMLDRCLDPARDSDGPASPGVPPKGRAS
ncbi:hypothetical protein Sa4125_27960 [Aureimonas sp. SA4125]|uniref:hypothetical protein n=1 Tax=Aureimonas sp. SA4125 TaxID=2826993 RepID=UPI001CC41146|nr:hypothetical protein [Aureimonas sp. SA4125]BDA85254.1 hypothetical protein Sa4125_27960 [Aureimonas sp. SA4125]